MKVFICLFAAIACAQASTGWNVAPIATGWNVAPVVQAKLLSTGSSQSSRTQDSAGNYAFSYNEQHSTGGSSRDERGNGWGAQGSYSLNVGDGRKRIVKYIADGAGFRAAISTNEPGTAAQPAASTSISSPYAPPQPVQPLPAPALAVAEPVALPAPALALPALHVAAPEPALAPVAIAPVLKAVHVAPAVSSYSTSINHVSTAPVAHVAALPEPVAIPAPVAQLRGWTN